ncbi:hypothetical protein DVH05_001154 [Phytophthora capsici]|nr:hypothetical protein DVH05_001154 [Phytophthora capsici]
MDLQLFLAKKKDGVWLTKRDVLEVTSELDPLDDTLAPLNSVGLSEEDVRYRMTKEDIKAKKVPVHVLLVVPTEDYLRSPATILLETILPHVLTHATTTLTEDNRDFRHNLCNFYGCYTREQSLVRCMLLDVPLPKSLVLASHLFRRSNEYLSFRMMQISDIDDVKNGLLLFKPLKYAFDHFQISFIRDDTDVFRLKLFDSTIKETPLIDLVDHHGKKVLSEEQTGELLSDVNNDTCLFDVGKTFGDVDGCALAFTGIERPYYHCLNLQARVALMVALKKGWIDESYDFKDFWSEVSLDDKMEMFHRSILNSVADI